MMSAFLSVSFGFVRQSVLNIIEIWVGIRVEYVVSIKRKNLK
jgi:hypothetical protein